MPDVVHANADYTGRGDYVRIGDELLAKQREVWDRQAALQAICPHERTADKVEHYEFWAVVCLNCMKILKVNPK